MPTYSAIIAGTGSHVPEKRLTNDDLSKMVETNDEWITQRTGIKERRIAGPGETTATLGTAAARRAIESAGLEPFGELQETPLGATEGVTVDVMEHPRRHQCDGPNS